METYETHSADETVDLGRRIAARLGVGDCVALVGPLGSGKTVLVRGLAAGLGLADTRLVASPTFVLVRQYPGRLPIYHLDLYRLVAAAAELAELGLTEMLEDGVALIEWADRAEGALPRPRWQVEIEHAGPTSRSLRVRRVD